MKLLFILMSLFLLSGCTVTVTKPAITEYIVSANKLNTTTTSKGCIDKSLKVVQAFSINSLKSLKMSYVQDNNKVFSYSESQWSEIPNRAITLQIYEKIRDSKLFKNVQLEKTRSRSNLVLEINIEDFLQYYSKDLKELNANIDISLTLIDIKSAEVIATKTFTSNVSTNILNADGGVEALNKALSDVLAKNIEWLDGVCK